MKISKVCLKEKCNGISPFEQDSLGNVVVLTGSNGSGKTRLLNLVHNCVKNLENKNYLELNICDNEGKEEVFTSPEKLKVVNYSHYDAVLQSPKSYSPYVIGKAKKLLAEYNYEETALNALLVIQDMAHGYSEEFRDGKDFEKFRSMAHEKFGIELEKTEDSIKLFGLDIEKAKLSPGQQYLLRIAIACQFNKKIDNLIFMLDEPEIHLHPKAMIEIIEYMRECFKNSQFWISTHSIELVSYMVATVEDSTVLCMNKGMVRTLRSDSSDVIDGLLGHRDNRIYMQQFYNTPDEYACVRFATECFMEDKTLSGKKKDPQQSLITSLLTDEQVIVDYGAGKGRLLEQLSLDSPDLLKKITYYAFDVSEKDSKICKTVMKNNEMPEEQYSNDIENLKSVLSKKVDYVFLVNVLHEISPKYWKEIFENIAAMLKDNGSLCIVEREELTVGEAPYDCGFLMVTENSVKKLFEKCERCTHDTKKYIVRYTIDARNVGGVDDTKIKRCIESIQDDAFGEIAKLRKKEDVKINKERYKKGIKLAFWLNQYANAALVLNNREEEEYD